VRVTIIAAVARNGVIGRDNTLPWRLPADLRRFKALTLGHTLVMGRKTFQSIGRALPGRTTVVVSRGGGGFAAPDGVRVAGSLDDALEGARAAGETEAFVAGGGEIYRVAIARADRLQLTRIDADVAGDATFPEFDAGAFRVVEREPHPAGGDAPFAYEFVVYDRV
jgi:dihydrofolate reductase